MNRNRQRLARLCLVAVALAIFLAANALMGCGGASVESDEAIVAEVGGRPIEMRRITDYITALHVDYPTQEKELAARERQLNKLIEDELFIIGAYSQSLDADIGIIELVDREKDKFLLDELFRHEVIDKAIVSEADIRESYSHWFDKARIQHIMVEDKATADSLLEVIKGGAVFGDVAEAVSIDRQTAVRGGDFGRDFKWEELNPALREPAFSLKEGEVGGPVQSDFGWHLVKVKSRSREEDRPLEELRSAIEAKLRRVEMEKRRVEQLDSVYARANITLVPEGVEAFRNQIRKVSDSASGELRARSPIPIDSLPGTIRDLHVGTYGENGYVSVAQMLDRTNSRPFEGRADMSDDEQIREAIFQLGLFDLLREEALRLRMDEQPLYKERLQEFREKLMAEKMRNSVISRNLRVPEEDVRAFYDANPDSFVDPKTYHVREVMVRDSALADRILDKAKAGTPLSQLAQEFTERTDFKNKGGDIGWVSPDRYPDLYEPASKLKPGEIGGPYSGVSQHSVIEVLESRPERQLSYDEVQASLFKHIQEVRTDSIITAYVDSMKTVHPVEIHEDVLREGLRVMASEAVPTQRG